MKRWIGLGRLAAMLWQVLRGLWIAHRQLPGLAPAERDATVQAWARRVLSAIGIELEVSGDALHAGPLLLVANHISWLDILVVLAARNVRFVSKSELKSWPLLGALATQAGTLYIERASRRDALRVVHRLADSLRAGEVVAIFPEGTTGAGDGVMPFHANLLQAALATDVAIQPLALCFLDQRSGALSTAPAYVGDETLLTSVWRTLVAPPLCARVQFGTPEHALGRDRRRWAADLREAVQGLRESALS